MIVQATKSESAILWWCPRTAHVSELRERSVIPTIPVGVEVVTVEAGPAAAKEKIRRRFGEKLVVERKHNADKVGERAGTHLVHDAATMQFNGLFANAQLHTYLLVQKALDDQLADLPFTGRQSMEAIAILHDFQFRPSEQWVGLKKAFEHFSETDRVNRFGKEIGTPRI